MAFALAHKDAVKTVLSSSLVSMRQCFPVSMDIVYNICFFSLSSLNVVQIPKRLFMTFVVLVHYHLVTLSLTCLHWEVCFYFFFNGGGFSGTQRISDLDTKIVAENMNYLECSLTKDFSKPLEIPAINCTARMTWSSESKMYSWILHLSSN